MKKKKIIFIGGTAYSGSTMLDMMLSSSDNAMSLGEIYALFKPWRKHHFKKIKELSSDSVWRRILMDGENKLYENIFHYFPNINTLIDSSKNPFWIHKQNKLNKSFEVKNVLISKSPEDLSFSFYRRGELANFYNSYVSYHKDYCSLIDSYKKVSYLKLIKNYNCLNEISDYCNITFDKKMFKFWEKGHSPFFGNNNTRRHIDNLDFQGEEKIQVFEDSTLKKVSYKPPTNTFMKKEYVLFREDVKIQRINELKEERDDKEI